MEVLEANRVNAERTVEIAVELIIARLRLADKVATAKWSINKPIEDPARERIILDALLSKGSQLELDLNWVEQFFGDQFIASKMIQYELFKKWGENEDLPTEQVSLQDSVRPLINELDAKLFQWAAENLQFCANMGLDLSKWTDSAKYCYKLDEIHDKAFRKAISHLCIENKSAVGSN